MKDFVNLKELWNELNAETMNENSDFAPPRRSWEDSYDDNWDDDCCCCVGGFSK